MELWLTYGFCAVAIVLAIAFALIKHPVHAALSFACVVLAAAGVYLLQEAAFVAASTVVVYAGATIIIFMFVLMFAQQTHLADYDLNRQSPLAAAVAAIALAAVVIAIVAKEGPKLEVALASKNAASAEPTAASATEEKPAAAEAAAVTDAASSNSDSEKNDSEKSESKKSETTKPADSLELNQSAGAESAEDAGDASAAEVADKEPAKANRFSVAKLGNAFYTRYLLAIEIAGTLLLVATIGAVVIAHREPQEADAKETA